MPDLAVNILHFGNLFNRDVNDFATRLEEVYTSNWSKRNCGFTVLAKGNMLVVSKKIKGKEKEFTAAMVNEPYSGDYNNRGTLREWANKYGLIVMVCHAGEYHENRIDILRVRNVMREENRRNDSILILTAVEQMMETIGEYRNDIEKAVAVYSALTGSPYSSETKLKGPSFLLPLYGEDTCQYTHRTTGRVFSMPINLLCDLDYASAYEPLLSMIIDRMSEVHGYTLSCLKGNYYINQNKKKNMNKVSGLLKKVENKLSYKRSVRLAVIGNTAAGKTYFLEDVNTLLLGSLGYKPDSSVSPFSYISNFPTDARQAKEDPEKQDNNGFGKTDIYACRHADHYRVRLKKGKVEYDFSYLDIPGEAINQNNFNACKKIYDKLSESKEKNIWLYEWKNGDTIYRTVSSEEIKMENIDQYDDENNAYKVYIQTRRSENYSSSKEFLPWFINECGEFISEKKVSGHYVIENYYDIVPDSFFDFLCDTYIHYDLRMKVEEFKEVATIFYFYYFLFQATDIVTIVRTMEEDPQGNLLNNIACLSPLTGKKYLGIKGADEFFNVEEFEKYCNSQKTVKGEAFENDLYSTLAMAIGDKINANNDENMPIVNMNNKQVQLVCNAINGFAYLIGSSDKKNNIPRHTYFLSTPITNNFKIDTFNDYGCINGNSSNVVNRMFFGSLQLIEDVLLANKKELPQKYRLCDDFLNFIRGTDRH